MTFATGDEVLIGAAAKPLTPYAPRVCSTTDHARGTAFAFDLDGTITRSELLPMIARELGLESEIRLLTDLTMAGTIPFEDSFRLRFAILRHAPLERIHRIVRDVELDPDIEAFIAAKRERCFVVTGNLDLWVAPLAQRLGCMFFTSTGGPLVNGIPGDIETVMRKNTAGLEIKRNFDRLVAIGDSHNDIPLFDVADTAIAFCGLHNTPDALISVSNYIAMDGISLCRLLNTL